MASGLPSIPFVGTVDPCTKNACSACCHDIEMILTEADLARLRARTGAPGGPDVTDAPDDFWFEADDGFLQLRTKDAPPARGSHAAPGAEPRPCVFLDADGRCSVWADRPEGCRLYPATWDEGLRTVALDSDYCPHTEGFRVPRAVADAVRRLGDKLEAERRARLGPAPRA